MTIYEGLTLGFVIFGVTLMILGFIFSKSHEKKLEDDVALDDETFRKQISLVDEKILELGAYHDFIKEDIEKKHKELLFLYQMISEKEKAIKNGQIGPNKVESEKSEKRKVTVIETTTKIKNSNKKIIGLKDKGYEAVEIAQMLDIGIGEVELVLNLFE